MSCTLEILMKAFAEEKRKKEKLKNYKDNLSIMISFSLFLVFKIKFQRLHYLYLNKLTNVHL